jgi:repressor LexA
MTGLTATGMGEFKMMARRRKKGLSDRQKKILEVLEDFQSANGYPPSIREICDQAAISSTSVVNYYLDQQKEMGYIERDGGVSRGLRLLKPLSEINAVASGAKAAVTSIKKSVEELLHIPVLGRIVAGMPMPVPPSDFSYFDADSMVDVASSLLPGREKGSGDLFALEVQGDSMIDAMVYDGDIVIMKPTKEARNGEMVAVWLNDRDETTLKYFYLENGRVRLQPANPTMKPIYIDDPASVDIQGKVIMVIRQVSGLTQ